MSRYIRDATLYFNGFKKENFQVAGTFQYEWKVDKVLPNHQSLDRVAIT